MNIRIYDQGVDTVSTLEDALMKKELTGGTLEKSAWLAMIEVSSSCRALGGDRTLQRFSTRLESPRLLTEKTTTWFSGTSDWEARRTVNLDHKSTCEELWSSRDLNSEGHSHLQGASFCKEHARAKPEALELPDFPSTVLERAGYQEHPSRSYDMDRSELLQDPLDSKAFMLLNDLLKRKPELNVVDLEQGIKRSVREK